MWNAALTVLRSGRYPLFEYFAVAPSVLRPPERLRIVAVDLPELTAKGDDFLRVVIWTPEPESLMSMVYDIGLC